MERGLGAVAIAVFAAVMVAGVVMFMSVKRSSRSPERAARAVSSPPVAVVPPGEAAKLQGIAVRIDEIEKKVALLQAAADELRKLEGDIARLEAAMAEISAAARETKRVERPLAPEPLPAAPRAAARAVLSDDFERDIAGWLVPSQFDKNVIGEISHLKGKDAAKTGEGAMKLSVEYAEGKIALAVRAGVGVREANRVDFWIRTERATMIYVGATEFDQSNYGMTFELRPADGWYHCKVDYSQFSLAETSRDENNRLDPAQVIGICVGDVGGFLEITGKNAVYIDDFRGLNAPAPAQNKEAEDAF